MDMDFVLVHKVKSVYDPSGPSGCRSLQCISGVSSMKGLGVCLPPPPLDGMLVHHRGGVLYSEFILVNIVILSSSAICK